MSHESGASESTSVELIPQPHGGALLSGGKPGNRGGGRPASVVKAALRESFADRIPLLEEIADDPTCKPRERIAALGLMSRHGLEDQGIDEELIQALASAVLDHVGDPAVLERIEESWVEILASRLS